MKRHVVFWAAVPDPFEREAYTAPEQWGSKVVSGLYLDNQNDTETSAMHEMRERLKHTYPGYVHLVQAYAIDVPWWRRLFGQKSLY